MILCFFFALLVFPCLFMFNFAFSSVFASFLFIFFPTFAVSSFLLSLFFQSPVPFIFFFLPSALLFILFKFLCLILPCHEPFPSLPFNNATLLSTVLLCYSIIQNNRNISMFCRSCWRGHNGTKDHEESSPRHEKHRVRSLNRGAPSPPASISLTFVLCPRSGIDGWT